MIGIYERTKEHNENISKALMGNKNAAGSLRTREYRKKMSKLLQNNKNAMGCKRTAEQKEYLRKINNGRIISKEWRQKISRGLTGKYMDGEHPNWKGGKKVAICEECGKKFKRYENDGQQLRFCSLKCRGKHWGKNHCGEKNHQWRGGLSFEPYGIEFNAKLKTQTRRRNNYICQECGYTEKQLGYALICHHIDYDKKNNNPENLISLCRSCHAQTNFKRNDWTNYFYEKMGNRGEV